MEHEMTLATRSLHEEVRDDIRHLRDKIAAKAGELSLRAEAARDQLSFSRQIEERPLAMFGAAVALGFLGGRLLLGGAERVVYVYEDEE
jgi:hypothetical protein